MAKKYNHEFEKCQTYVVKQIKATKYIFSCHRVF